MFHISMTLCIYSKLAQKATSQIKLINTESTGMVNNQKILLNMNKDRGSYNIAVCPITFLSFALLFVFFVFAFVFFLLYHLGLGHYKGETLSNSPLVYSYIVKSCAIPQSLDLWNVWARGYISLKCYRENRMNLHPALKILCKIIEQNSSVAIPVSYTPQAGSRQKGHFWCIFFSSTLLLLTGHREQQNFQ